MKYCSRCVLSENFPGITFDSNNICNYCTSDIRTDNNKRNEYLVKFEKLIADTRNKSGYDVIMAYSGGKDSTYTMLLLSRKYRLKILAWTLDNGFLAKEALDNISRMTRAAGAESVVFRPPFETMKDLFNVSATEDFYASKTLDRASTICTTCIGIVKSMVLKTAIEKRIPIAAFGWSPGQAPISSAIMQAGPSIQQFTNRSVRDPLVLRVPASSQFFVNDNEMQTRKEEWPVNVHPLAFMDYNEGDILQYIESYGWKKPSDTDSNSTNCLLNPLAVHLHKLKYGFHPYEWEIAGIVRSGSMTRQEGLEKITAPPDTEAVKSAAEKIGLKL